MLSPASLKDLSKAIHAFLSQPALPLPDPLLGVVAGYLQRHEKHDDAASGRLQEELLAIFDKHVKGNAAALGPWIAVLRRLLPALKTPDRILPWFDTYKGLLDSAGVDKLVVDEAVAALVDVVTVTDTCHTTSPDLATNPIIDRLLSIWMTRLYPSLAEGNTSHEYNERLVRQALKSFGKKRPKALFTSMNGCFVKKSFRHATLRFFCDFIQDQPPHLHQVLHTSIFSNLLACLQHDTSTTVVSSALTVLIMLLPHMPSSLVPHLPTLFNIYARLLFWDRERSRAAGALSDDADQQSRGWDVCAYDPEIDDFSVPQLSNYYTILYGLYPINFMDYIRKPQRYLRHANMSSPDEIEVQPTEIRHRSERFRRCHLLHPNFYTLTIDSEKTDFGRWIKSEAAEVLVDCTGLCRAADHLDCASREALPPIPGADVAAVDDRLVKDVSRSTLPADTTSKRDSWRNSQLTTDSETSNVTPLLTRRRASHSSQPSGRHGGEQGPPSGRATDSPTIPAQLTQSLSQTQLQDLINSNKVIKSGLHQSLANDSVPSLSLSHQESMADRPAAAAQSVVAPPLSASSLLCATALGTQVAHLQRRVLVLENDLSFERYVKQQHMAHIGELRRRQVVEAATEAETQNLVMMNRNLKSRFEEAKKAERQVRKESEKGRALAKKWESDLASKLKHLRDESKKASAELGALGRELEESKQECEKLRKLVCEAEVKELNWKQSMQSIEIQGAEMARLRAQVQELTKSEHDHQVRDMEWKAALSSAQAAEAQVEMMKKGLAAQEHDAERTRSLLQAQVRELQAQLADTQEEKERPGSNSNLVIESAFAASRAKQAELQRQYNLLMRKYTALQSSLLDMQSETLAESAGAQEPQAPSGDCWSMSPASPAVVMARSHLSVSDAEGTAYNVTPPLASHPGTPTSAELERRGSAPEGFGAGPVPLGTGDARHFGSGFPSRARKDGRDKGGREEANVNSSKPKKEKKSSGLRGIRGFV
ncbi:hamartin protein [Hirsutella rhossiliensis]|uniref:Hamartin protein n=1 Tax=Hirsutella rhossiliensis TaxID=111463 RepID=A0A9P8MYV8_9HYPO|nr:hamartin protein [Hirsutella rhossiliensis]KAH0964558.1 hamartin protein [Hirsutella rhossiliensis]